MSTPRRSREQWQQLAQEQVDSGLNPTDFCRRQSINLTSFGNWKRRLKKEQAVASDPHWREVSTLPVRSSVRWDIELDLGDGLCLRLRQP